MQWKDKDLLDWVHSRVVRAIQTVCVEIFVVNLTQTDPVLLLIIVNELNSCNGIKQVCARLTANIYLFYKVSRNTTLIGQQGIKKPVSFNFQSKSQSL